MRHTWDSQTKFLPRVLVDENVMSKKGKTCLCVSLEMRTRSSPVSATDNIPEIRRQGKGSTFSRCREKIFPQRHFPRFAGKCGTNLQPEDSGVPSGTRLERSNYISKRFTNPQWIGRVISLGATWIIEGDVQATNVRVSRCIVNRYRAAENSADSRKRTKNNINVNTWQLKSEYFIWKIRSRDNFFFLNQILLRSFGL